MSEFVGWNMIVYLKENEYKITDFARSSYLDLADRFTVHIPYGNSTIRARFLFDALSPLSAPDIVLISPVTYLEIDFKSLVAEWRPDDKSSLIRLCDRLVSQYRGLQHSSFLANSGPALQELYSWIRDGTWVDGPIDINLGVTNGYLYDVVFSFPLPFKLLKFNCRRRIMCHIKAYPDHHKFTIDLEYPEWAHYLHMYTVSHIFKFKNPYWHFKAIEVVISNVLDFISPRIEGTEDKQEQRSLFVSYLLEHFIGLEIDENAKQVDFIVIVDKKNTEEPVKAQVVLDEAFPEVPPTFNLFSLRSLDKQGIITSHGNTSWKHSASIKENAEKFATSLKKAANKFAKAIDKDKNALLKILSL